MRIPGFNGGAGALAFASDAAVTCQLHYYHTARTQMGGVPIPLGSLASGLVEVGLGVSTMVDVDEERLKVFASGARWVSLSSVQKSDRVA